MQIIRVVDTPMSQKAVCCHNWIQGTVLERSRRDLTYAQANIFSNMMVIIISLVILAADAETGHNILSIATET